MTHRILNSSVLAILLAAISASAGSAAPVPEASFGPSSTAPGDTVIHDSIVSDERWTDPDAELAIMVQLDGPTGVELYRSAGYIVGDGSPRAVAARHAIYDSIAATQRPIRHAIESTGAWVFYTFDSVWNGFQVYATPGQIRAMAKIPGVRRLILAPRYERMLDDAVPTIGADRVIDTLGYTGEGVNVAIIDTGIDYFHKNLGGSGNPGDFRRNNRGTVEPGSFPTRKVVGGYDFAGAGYTGGNRPAPDGDPVDDQSHGSHVAGISAGMDNNPNVPHGVAPDANLIALKVFGARGGTNVVQPAIEWCTDANMGQPVPGVAARCDVINMSLGSPWAFGVEEYTNVILQATQAGVVVLSAAGNSGNVAFITGSPGASPFTLSVASTVAGGARVDKIQAFHGGTTDDIEALEADPQFAVQITEMGSLRAPLRWLGRGCTGDPSKEDVSEAIALIAAGGCSQREVVERAVSEGAVGAILYNTVDQLLPVGAGGEEFAEPFGIPIFGISLSDGKRLERLLTGGTPVEALFDANFKNSIQKDSLGDTISSFSSRGPSRLGITQRGRGGELKPELAAPGSAILAPLFGTGDRGASFNGTSMATPMVAGAAALIIDRLRSEGIVPADIPLTAPSNPQNIDALDVAAMLVNYTATVWARQGIEPVPLARGGSGRIDALQAVRSNTIVRAGQIASVNYGRRPFSLSEELEGISFTIKNLSDSAKTYKISGEMLFENDKDAGLEFLFTSGELDPKTNEITIPAADRRVVTVRPLITPAELKPFAAYGGQNVMSSGLTDAEYDAHIVVTEVDGEGDPLAGGDRARVPMYLMPRATSLVRATDETVTVDRSTKVGPLDYVNESRVPGRAEIFAHLGDDSGDDVILLPALDIEHTGARVVTVGEHRYVEFAIQTRGNRQLPLESSFRVLMDTDRNGSIDRMIFNDDIAWFLGTLGLRAATDGRQRMLMVEVSGQDPFSYKLPVNTFGGEFAYAEFAEVTLDTRLIILRAPAEALGYGDDEPIAFDAVIWHHPNFPELRGRPGRHLPYESAPDGGFVVNDGGGRVTGAGVTYNDVVITDKRMTFDEEQLGFDVDTWTVDVGRDGEGYATVTQRDPAGDDGVLDKIFSVYTFNTPDEFYGDVIGDSQVLTIEQGDVAPPPTREPTDPPPPTATDTPRPGDPTPTAEDPGTSEPPVGIIYLPATLRSAEVRGE